MEAFRIRFAHFFVSAVILAVLNACSPVPMTFVDLAETDGETADHEGGAQEEQVAENGGLSDEMAGDADKGDSLILVPTATPEAESIEPAAPLRYNTALILDASGSMRNELDGRTRLLVAQDAVGNLSAAMPSSINASLWVYGHRVEQEDQAESCRDIEEAIGLGVVEPDRFDEVAHGFAAKGYTPITDALALAAQSLPVGPDQRNAIVLISDGEETCGGDPCALAAALAASDAQITIYAIALAADDVTRAQLLCIAEAGGGTFADASNGEELTLALEEATQTAADNTFSVVEGLVRPEVVVVSPDGRNVYAAGGNNGALVVFRRDANTGQLSQIGIHRNNEGLIFQRPHGMVISPDGATLYATTNSGTPAAGFDLAVAIFDRDVETGNLTYIGTADAFNDQEEVDTAWDVAVSPDGQNVYVTGYDGARKNDAVAVFQRDGESGLLERVQVLGSGEDDVDGLAEATNVLVSPDGGNVYVSGVWKELAVFTRDPSNGMLSPLQALVQGEDLNKGLLGGLAMQMSSDGRHLYLTARRDGTVSHFLRDVESGTLLYKDQLRGFAGERPDDSALFNLYGAHGLALAPDGDHLYVASDNSDFLVSLARDEETGNLTFVQDLQDDVDGVDGLKNAHAVVISPDGRSLYVAGFDDSALGVFSSDPDTGQMIFVEVIRSKKP